MAIAMRDGSTQSIHECAQMKDLAPLFKKKLSDDPSLLNSRNDIVMLFAYLFIFDCLILNLWVFLILAIYFPSIMIFCHLRCILKFVGVSWLLGFELDFSLTIHDLILLFDHFLNKLTSIDSLLISYLFELT